MLSVSAYLPPHGELDAVASRFAPATKELREDRELLRRVDTKYVCDAAAAVRILTEIIDEYAALPVASGNVATYRSVYFDTRDLRSYHDHRRGRRPRHKVRIRHYPDRRLSFLEVKAKRNETVTDKRRLPVEFGSEQLGAAEIAFLHTCGLDPDQLEPTMRIEFQRISLVGVGTAERVTLDVGLEATSNGDERFSFGELVVVEVKQSPFCVRTPVMRALNRARLRECAMSKYALSTAMLRPELRKNRLLPDVRAIERMWT